MDLLAETCSSKRKAIRIAGDDKPIDVVKGRLMKLNSMHIQYVLDCLHENTTYVRDIQSKFIRPKIRPYQTDNYYDILKRAAQAEKEVDRIVSAVQRKKK